MTQEQITIKSAFKHLNAYKRARALFTEAQIKSQDNATALELEMFRTIDQLELTLRGLQRQILSQDQTYRFRTQEGEPTT